MSTEELVSGTFIELTNAFSWVWSIGLLWHYEIPLMAFYGASIAWRTSSTLRSPFLFLVASTRPTGRSRGGRTRATDNSSQGAGGCGIAVEAMPWGTVLTDGYGLAVFGIPLRQRLLEWVTGKGRGTLLVGEVLFTSLGFIVGTLSVGPLRRTSGRVGVFFSGSFLVFLPSLIILLLSFLDSMWTRGCWLKRHMLELDRLAFILSFFSVLFRL